MSFGYSVGDAFLLVQLAWKTVRNSRKACGEHDELTREVSSLHLVIRRLEKEVSRSESPINRPDDTYKEELRAIVGGCEKVLKVLNKVLEKYNTLSEKERSAKKTWQRVRFGNGELADMRDLREKLTYYTSALSLFMNMISMGSIGRVEEQMENAGGDIKEIRIAINGITAHLMSGSNREGSILTTYADDDKAVWKEFRKELIEDGFSSSIIRKHKRLIMAYIKELGDRGLLDDEDSHDIKNLSEEDGANSDDHATPSTETEDPPKVTSKSPSETESEMSEDDLRWATGNGVETTPRIISDTGSFSFPIRTRKSSGRMEEERKNLRAYHEDEMDDRGRISRREREAEQSAEEIFRDQRTKSRDKDRVRVDSKSRYNSAFFHEDDSSDSESDRLQEERTSRWEAEADPAHTAEEIKGYQRTKSRDKDRVRRFLSRGRSSDSEFDRLQEERVSIWEAEADPAHTAEEIKGYQRTKSRDKDKRRDVESKSRGKFVHFKEPDYKEPDYTDSELDISSSASHNSSPGPRRDPSSASPRPTKPHKKPFARAVASFIIAETIRRYLGLEK